MSEEITITIPKDDTKPMVIEVNGVKGEGCKALTAGIEALGTVVNEEPTQEMYEDGPEITHHLRQQA